MHTQVMMIHRHDWPGWLLYGIQANTNTRVFACVFVCAVCPTHMTYRFLKRKQRDELMFPFYDHQIEILFPFNSRSPFGFLAYLVRKSIKIKLIDRTTDCHIEEEFMRFVIIGLENLVQLKLAEHLPAFVSCKLFSFIRIPTFSA